MPELKLAFDAGLYYKPELKLAGATQPEGELQTYFSDESACPEIAANFDLLVTESEDATVGFCDKIREIGKFQSISTIFSCFS